MGCRLANGDQYSCLSEFRRCAGCPVTAKENALKEKYRGGNNGHDASRGNSSGTSHKGKGNGTLMMGAIAAAIWGAVWISDEPEPNNAKPAPSRTTQPQPHTERTPQRQVQQRQVQQRQTSPAWTSPKPMYYPTAPRNLPPPHPDADFGKRRAAEERTFFLGLSAVSSNIHNKEDISLLYQGEVKDGKIHGNGRILYQDPQYNPKDNVLKYFMGYFEDGLINGYGRMTYFAPDIDYIEGHWYGTVLSAKPVGTVSIHYQNGTVFSGELKKDGFYESGYCLYTDKTVRAAHYKNGPWLFPEC